MKIPQWLLQAIPPFPSSDFQVPLPCTGTHYIKQMIKKKKLKKTCWEFRYVSCASYLSFVGTGGIYNLAHLNKTLNFNIEASLGGFGYMKNKTTQNVS